MFSLIISIIGIALVIALAGAAIYYGGDSFRDGNVKADAARYRNQASQISAALILYKTSEGSIPANFEIADLAPLYLKSIPDGNWSINSESNHIVRTGLTDSQCLAANLALGFNFLMTDPDAANYHQATSNPDYGVPLCSWSEIGQEVPCCYSPS